MYNIIRLEEGNVPLFPSSIADAILLQNGMNLSDKLGLSIESVIKIESWKFKLISSISNAIYNDTTPSAKDFDDTLWNSISIPHDWSIYQGFDSSCPASSDNAFIDGGDAWYRTSFDVENSSLHNILYFEGVYMESDVYINGQLAKSNRYGYNPFYIDLSNYATNGNTYVVAVFCRCQQPCSRWYSGAGIYRNVHLISGNDLDFQVDSCKLNSLDLQTTINSGYGNISINTNIRNNLFDGVKIDMIYQVVEEEDKILCEKEETYYMSIGINSISDTIKVDNPSLWSPVNPSLYKINIYLLAGGTRYNLKSVNYGFRYFSFNASSGFWLNGENVKLNGVCLHHDLGCLGAEENESGYRRQLQLLKDMGCNAIRTSHNPTSKIFLDLCEKMGFLVMEEFFDCWEEDKRTYDFARYFDDYYKEVIKSTIMRDYNSPSVIMWSIGNEITWFTNLATKYYVGNDIISEIRKYDGYRPTTWGNPNIDTITAEEKLNIDIHGFNYLEDNLDSIHASHPDWCMYGSETGSVSTSRGCYETNSNNYECNSYEGYINSWTHNSTHAKVLKAYKKSYLAGQFIWTGIDYLGETSPYDRTYPVKSSFFGVIDLCGFPKDAYYLYQSQWTNNPMIHILPHWNWTVGSDVKVWLYSNCYKVELFLNDVSLGSKLQSEIGSDLQFEYNVTFALGILKAVGYDSENNIIATDKVSTANNPSKILLKSDKIALKDRGNDYAFIEVNVTDEDGNIIPNSSEEINFTITGGIIKGLDNGNQSSVELFKGSNVRKCYNGKCLCVISLDNSENDIILKATSGSLTSVTVIIKRFSSTF